MPVALPIIAAYAAAAGYTYAAIALAAASMVVQAQQASRAKAKARNKYESTLTDRSTMIRSAVEPRRVVYGRQTISGPMVFVGSTGEFKDQLHLVIALAAHELDAIESIVVGDQPPVSSFDEKGWALEGLYYGGPGELDPGPTIEVDKRFVLPPGVLSFTLPDAQSIIDGTFRLQEVLGNSATDAGESYRDLELGLNYTVDGRVVQLMGTAHMPTELNLKYSYLNTPATGYIRPNSFMRVKKYAGAEGQQADPDLVALFPDQWSADHRGIGVAYLYVTLNYNQDLFQSGIPNIKAVVRGKKIYDPRTDSTGYSENSALVATDWLQSDYGFRCSDEEMHWPSVIAAANIADEQLEKGPAFGGGSQARFTCNGVISTEGDRKSALSDILQTMGGGAAYMQGKWRVYAGAYRAPTLTLTEDDITDMTGVSLTTRMSRKDLFNAVRGKYFLASPETGEADFPPMANPTFAAQDGDEIIYADISLPFTNDTLRAQQLAKLHLGSSRRALTLAATFNLRAYTLNPFDTVRLTSPRYGFVNKVFAVKERTFLPASGVQLTLMSEDAEMYAWNNGEAETYDPATDIVLPDILTVAAPEGLSVLSGEAQVLINADGTAIPRLLVTWNQSRDIRVIDGGSVEVEYQIAGDNAWNRNTLSGGETATYFNGVQVGKTLVVRARFLNSADVKSTWAYQTHGSIGKTENTSTLGELVAVGKVFGINLSWSLPSNNPHLAYTEIWKSPTNNLSAATVMGAFAYPQRNYTLSGLKAGEGYFFWARLVDKSGNVGAWHPTGGGVYGETSSDASDILDYIRDQILDTETAQELLRQIADLRPRIDEAEQMIDDALEQTEEVRVRVLGRLQKLVDDIEIAKLQVSAERYLRDDGDQVVERKVNNLEVTVNETIGGAITEINEIIATDREVVAYRLSILNARVDDADATILEESVARASETDALATTLVALTARVTGSEASVVEERTARADADEALAQTTTLLTARVGEAESEITTEQTARVDGDEALASTLSTLTVRVGSNEAALTTEQKVRADQDSALTSSFTGLQTRVGTAESSLTSLSQTVSGNGTSFASQLSTLHSQVGSLGASLVSESQTRASQDSGLVSQINTAYLTGTNAAAAASSAMTVAQGLDGRLKSTYSIRAQVNAYGQVWMAGMALGVEDVGGAYQSQALFVADRFAILHSHDQPYVSVPFAVQNGQVIIKDAVIGNAAISTLKVAGEAITIPRTWADGGSYGGQGGHIVSMQVSMYMPEGGQIVVFYTGNQGYSGGTKVFGFRLKINGQVVNDVFINEISGLNSMSGAAYVGAGWATLAMEWFGEPGIVLTSQRMTAIGAMR